MVVSAILLATMAPITGALFGASYGTAIRIGYEIIFPALFGDMINDKKNALSASQEDGAKRTIKALHTMFTATGGASALEFGIDQGIEMAKKKTESPDVQDMIDLNLGLTSRQLNKRGKAQQFQDPLKDVPDITERIDRFDPRASSDFLNLTHAQIIKIFTDAPVSQLEQLQKMFIKEGHDSIITKRVKELVKKRLAKRKTTQEAIDKATKEGSIVREIATQYNVIVKSLALLKTFRNMVNKIAAANLKAKRIKIIRKQISTYNRFVQINRRANLSLNTEKSIAVMRPVPK